MAPPSPFHPYAAASRPPHPLRRRPLDAVEIELKYAGYISRQEAAIEKLRRSEEKLLPSHLDYQAISGLRAETRQKLTSIRPATFGQAARISGITPADLALLSVFLESRSSVSVARRCRIPCRGSATFSTPAKPPPLQSLSAKI